MVIYQRLLVHLFRIGILRYKYAIRYMPSISTTYFKVGPQPDYMPICRGGKGHFLKWPPYQFSKCRISLNMGDRNLILVSIPMFSGPMISNMVSLLMYQAFAT